MKVEKKQSGWSLMMMLAAVSIIAGCSKTTIESLRTDPGFTYSFSTTLSYDQAYIATANGFTRCLTGSILQSTMAIRPRIDQSKRTATIAWVEHSIDSGYWATIEFAATDTGTSVRVFAINNPGIKKLGLEVERWISGAKDCSFGKGFFSEHFSIVE